MERPLLHTIRPTLKLVHTGDQEQTCESSRTEQSQASCCVWAWHVGRLLHLERAASCRPRVSESVGCNARLLLLLLLLLHTLISTRPIVARNIAQHEMEV